MKSGYGKSLDWVFVYCVAPLSGLSCHSLQRLYLYRACETFWWMGREAAVCCERELTGIDVKNLSFAAAG